MSVLVYGICERGDAAIEGRGLQQRPLRGLCGGSLMAIVSDHDEPPPRAVETLWEYEEVVERIAAERSMIPARFGSVLDDDDAVLDMLSARHETLLAVIGQTRGAVELALRATWEQPPEPDSQTGTGYLRTRMQLRQRAREVADGLMPLGRLSRTSRCELPGRPQEPMRCAYLVDRDKVDDFAASVQQLDEQLADVELVCTGPWPPYSFAEGVRE
jgi:Gas vesicle synthesis protein GvpL/GvpF